MLVSIIFDSGYGHTATQARAVSEGVRNVPGAEAELIAVSEGPVPWDKLEARTRSSSAPRPTTVPSVPASSGASRTRPSRSGTT